MTLDGHKPESNHQNHDSDVWFLPLGYLEYMKQDRKGPDSTPSSSTSISDYIKTEHDWYRSFTQILSNHQPADLSKIASITLYSNLPITKVLRVWPLASN